MSDLRKAAEKALDALQAVLDMDRENGISDPDIVEAVGALRGALAERQRRFTFRRGEKLRVVGGQMRGAIVSYVGVNNSTQIKVEHEGEIRVVMLKFVTTLC